LSVIQPLVDDALSQVSQITKSNLDELKALRMPPEPCHDVLFAVLSLFGKQDTSWNAMKKFLGERGFIDTILNFDARTITPKTMKDVTNIILRRSSSFEKEAIFKVSRAAGPLALWVKAIIQFSEVLVQVEPLTKQLEKIE
jgi:dynein heavy chain 2, cytosolic